MYTACTCVMWFTLTEEVYSIERGVFIIANLAGIVHVCNCVNKHVQCGVYTCTSISVYNEHF